MWKRNLFLIPSGCSGKAFVDEIARLFKCYAECDALELIALKACMVMQTLMLQKPRRQSKAKEHTMTLHRRLSLWLNGDIDPLFVEGQSIQAHLRSVHNSREDDKLVRRFTNLMSKGMISAALRCLEDTTSRTVLNPSDIIQPPSQNAETVLDTLKCLHPPAQTTSPDAMLNAPTENPLPLNNCIFEAIDTSLIKKVACQTQGASGSSGVDAFAWKRMCTSFGSASNNLCHALASVAKRLCTTQVAPQGLSALVACRLIPLDKCPGIRPIAIGEVARRIIAKAIMQVVKTDVTQAAGSLQVCAGQEGGCEAAIHAFNDLFSRDDTDAVLLADASNAFNSLNRSCALHNMQFICPALATVLRNTYQMPVRLFLHGGEELQSSEGTTQGDPLGMAMYALAITPLINELHHQCPDAALIWFADDSTATAKCTALRKWWDLLCASGPKYGYHPNASKSFLIVKEPYLDEAKRIFDDTNVIITSQGARHLGAALGSSDFIHQFVELKVTQWKGEIERLAKFAFSQPHAAYAAFIHGVQSKWSFVQRTVNGISDLMQPLEDCIRNKLIPAITGRPSISDLERALLSLPARMGGMDIRYPIESDCSFSASVKITSSLADRIIKQDANSPLSTEDIIRCKSEVKHLKSAENERKLQEIRQHLSTNQTRLLDCALEKGASSWVTAIPLDDHGFMLHKGDFRDSICLRYGWSIQNLPAICGCGQSLTVDHAFVCHKGGYPSLRHNEIRDLTVALLHEVCPNTGIEPGLQPLHDEKLDHATAIRDDEARLDIKATGFWRSDQDAFFDVRVFHPNASSYCQKSLASLYRLHENEKKRSYAQRVREIERAAFTPLVLSTTGGYGPRM